MSFVTNIAALLATIITLVAYGSAYAAGSGPAAGFPFRHTDFDFKVAWQTSTTDRGIAVDGLLKNIRYPSVEGVDLSVWLVGKDKKVLVRDTAFPIPQRIGERDYSPFSLMLRNGSLAGGEVLQFLIRYRVNEGGDGGYSWLSSFAVDAATGAKVTDTTTARPDDW